MVKKRKIAFSGKANSGKNTIASIFANLIYHNFSNYDDEECAKILAFADPIKEIAKIMFPSIDDNVLWGASELRNSIIPDANNSLSVRQLLIDIGKNGRNYNPDIWINTTIFSINEFIKQNHFNKNWGIITDCRYRNELKTLHDNNFFVCRIIRPDSNNTSTDISEIDLDDVPNSEFDATLVNKGTLKELELEIESLFNSLL